MCSSMNVRDTILDRVSKIGFVTRARFYNLAKNSSFCPSEGAGGFSLPNRAPQIQCGFSHGSFFRRVNRTFSPGFLAGPESGPSKIAQPRHILRRAVAQPAVELRGLLELLAAPARHNNVLARHIG